MEIVVSGASGFIGSRLVPALERRGHRVVRLTRGDAAGDGDSIVWDPAAGQLDAASLEGTDAVVHLAGESIGERRWSEQQKARLLQSRTRGTSLLSEALAGLDRPPSVLLSGSAIGIYGDRGDEILTEEAAVGEGFLADVCQAWEAASGLARQAGVRVANLRTGIVLAAKGGALGRMLPLFRFGLGGRLGSGNQWMSWISIDDHIEATCWLLDHDVEGPVNLTAPEPVTNADFTETLGGVLSRPTVLPTPMLPLKARYGSEMVAETLLASQRVQPAALEAGGFGFRHADLDDALRAILARPAELA